MASKVSSRKPRRRLFIFILILLSVWPAYVGYRLYLAFRVLPMGVGPAGPNVSCDAFDDVWYEGKVLLVGLGDSVTKGLGAPMKNHYFAMLQKNDDDLYPDMAGCDLGNVLPNLEAINLSENYTVTKEHLKRQLPRLKRQDEDVRGIVVITSGGNDLIHDYGRSEPVDGAVYGCSYEEGIVWTENIKSRIGQLIDGVIERFPGGCEIFLANIYDPSDGASDPQIKGLPRWRNCSRIVELTNMKIAELCDEYENVHLVDIHSEFMGHGFHCRDWWRKSYKKEDPTHWYYWNIEDPNPRGYDAIRRLFLLEIIEAIGGK